jgi:hypothetical protein
VSAHPRVLAVSVALQRRRRVRWCCWCRSWLFAFFGGFLRVDPLGQERAGSLMVFAHGGGEDPGPVFGFCLVGLRIGDAFAVGFAYHIVVRRTSHVEYWNGER